MKIWEAKPPGTLWATPGLFRDSHVGIDSDALVSSFHFESPQAGEYGIYGGQNGIGTRFSAINFFLPCQYYNHNHPFVTDGICMFVK